MHIGRYQFDRTEFAGSLGDLGTLIPLTVGLILINHLNLTAVFLMIGLFYLISGFYFNLPLPVQPLKLVSAIAIAAPLKITPAVISASGLIFAVFLLFLAVTGLIDWIAKLVSKPVVRGIQFGLGLILIKKGLDFIVNPQLLLQRPDSAISLFNIPLNLVVGLVGSLAVLLLLTNKKVPAALFIIFTGIVVGILAGSLHQVDLVLGMSRIDLVIPTAMDFWNAAILLVIPQIPLTLGNAIISTSDLARSLFGENRQTKKVTYRALTYSIGLANLFTSAIAGMPMCHGAGGLAAHYRFGARTGGSNIMIGLVFLVIALLFGSAGLVILMSIPNGILGVLLLFAGLELCYLIADLTEKKDLFVAFLIAGIGFGTTNMGVAFLIGLIAYYFIRWRNITFT